MIIKETLLEILKSQKKDFETSDNFIKRELMPDINLSARQAVVISGIRRTGKSTLLRLIIQDIGSYNYFNFEDSRATNFEINDFERLYDLQTELNPECQFYFFDEIQNIPNWERFVRTLLDRNKKVFITGSNASLLSSELGTKLTGRHLKYELFPFSFSEMLDFKNLPANLKSFENYMFNGGFPEFLLAYDIKILQELFKDILYRDIFVRYSIRNTQVLKNLAFYLISNIGKEFSYNKLKKHFELGSVNTVITFIEYLEDSYLIFTIPKFDYSYKKQLANPKKIYAIDTGLIMSNSVSFSKDLGRILENIVFLHLKRRGKEIYYFKEKNECDFVVKSYEKITEAYQVCYKISEENKTREINGVLEAINKFNLSKGTILTLNQEDKFEFDGKKIDFLPVWKWMLD